MHILKTTWLIIGLIHIKKAFIFGRFPHINVMANSTDEKTLTQFRWPADDPKIKSRDGSV